MKLLISICAVFLALVPLLIVYLIGWVEYKLTIRSALVTLFLGVFIVALIGEIFGFAWLRKELSSKQQDEIFLEKTNVVIAWFERLRWPVIGVFLVYIGYTIFAKKYGI